MCGRATLRIELSTPCMMFAIMIESVIMPRLGTGANGGGPPPPSQPTLPGQHHHGRPAITCSRLTLPSRDGWVVRDIEVEFVSFGKPSRGPTLTSRDLVASALSRIDQSFAIAAAG